MFTCTNEEDGIKYSDSKSERDSLLNIQYSGKVYDFFPNDSLKLLGYFKDGYKDSVWTGWSDDGLVILIKEYKEGERHGIYEEWVDNDLTHKITYQNGNLHGRYQEFFSSGQIKVDGNYFNNSKDDVWMEYFLSGTPYFEEHFVNGQMKQDLEYYNNGNIKFDYNYRDNVTEITHYYQNGVIKSHEKGEIEEEYYPSGKVKSTKDGRKSIEYYENGYISKETESYGDGINVIWDDVKKYSSSGIKIMEQNMRTHTDTGEEYIKSSDWTESGVPKSHTEYKYVDGDLIRHGEQISYYDSGNMKESHWYTDGNWGQAFKTNTKWREDGTKESELRFTGKVDSSHLYMYDSDGELMLVKWADGTLKNFYR